MKDKGVTRTVYPLIFESGHVLIDDVDLARKRQKNRDWVKGIRVEDPENKALINETKYADRKPRQNKNKQQNND